MGDPDSGAALLLARAGVAVNRVQPAIDSALKGLPQVQGDDNVRSGASCKACSCAPTRRLARGDTYIASELFLLALADDKGDAGRIPARGGLCRRRPWKRPSTPCAAAKRLGAGRRESNREALSKYTLDLTERARQGKLDPVIGRDDEIRRTIQILQRRTKNNPVLIGEPGVRETAIVEGLAQRIVNDEVPDAARQARALAGPGGAACRRQVP